MCGHADAQLDDAQLDDAELDESSRGALLRGVRARSQGPARRSGHSRAAVALREPGDAHLGDAKLGDAKLDDAKLDESSRGALRRGVRARSQGPAGRRQRARAAPAGVVAQRGPGEAQLADAQLDDAQLDDAQLEAGTWGAEGLSWHTIAADALPRPGASIVERRTVCSLGRLRVLPGGGGGLGRLRLGLCEGADWRADDVDVQFAEGPRSNRGNPNRPETMRGVGTGGNPAGTDAMNQLRRVLMPCGTTGCTALVEKFAAAKQANAATRETLGPSDGCAGKQCTLGRWLPTQFAARQLAYGAALLHTDYLLIRRPMRASAPAVTVACSEDTVRIANAAIASALRAVPSRILLGVTEPRVATMDA